MERIPFGFGDGADNGEGEADSEGMCKCLWRFYGRKVALLL